MKEKINRLVNSFRDDIIGFRHELHKIPEPGFGEYKTSRFLIDVLKELGLEVSEMAKTGVVALLRGTEPGKTIAIRADMDGLPLEEVTGLEYSSQNPGYMHACGHDAHMAIALGAAKVLRELKGELKGNVKFIFQPAEEGPGGAKRMIEEGVLDDPKVDAIIGLHVWPELPAGKIGVKTGPVMAAPDWFVLKIIGKGGHGALPHKSVDPIVVGSQVVLALQTLISREVDPLDSAVLSIGEFKAGTRFNIIPEEVIISGTVRTFNPDLRNKIPSRMEEIVAGITKAMGASYELDYSFYYPALVNEPEFTRFFIDRANEFIGEQNVITDIRPSMGGEDFSYFLQKVPGTFFFLGSRNEEKGKINPIHHPHFDIDEEVIPLGTALFCQTVLSFLLKNLK